MAKKNTQIALLRIIAFAIDFTIIALFIATTDKWFKHHINNGENLPVVFIMFILVPVYFFLYWAFRINLGKRLFRLKIVDAKSGKQATVFQLFKRCLLFSLLISFNVFLLIPIFASKENQGLHDMFAKTYVIQEDAKKQEDIFDN